MDMDLKERFLDLWNTYVPGAELPIIFYYTDEPGHGEEMKPPKEDFRCIFQDLTRVRKGNPCSVNSGALGCMGAKIYLGFTPNPVETQGARLRELMCAGIPGTKKTAQFAGRGMGLYKKGPAYVDALVKPEALFEVPYNYIVFKRWDVLEKADNPLAVIFFAFPDVISGLFALANFDEPGLHGVITPYASGCGSIVMYPYKQLKEEHPKAILGMFDIMPRRFVPSRTLTFAVPWPKFVRMAEHLEESFFITEHWEKLQQRSP